MPGFASYLMILAALSQANKQGARKAASRFLGRSGKKFRFIEAEACSGQNKSLHQIENRRLF
jgi:hypothetical protein